MEGIYIPLEIQEVNVKQAQADLKEVDRLQRKALENTGQQVKANAALEASEKELSEAQKKHAAAVNRLNEANKKESEFTTRQLAGYKGQVTATKNLVEEKIRLKQASEAEVAAIKKEEATLESLNKTFERGRSGATGFTAAMERMTAAIDNENVINRALREYTYLTAEIAKYNKLLHEAANAAKVEYANLTELTNLMGTQALATEKSARALEAYRKEEFLKNKQSQLTNDAYRKQIDTLLELEARQRAASSPNAKRINELREQIRLMEQLAVLETKYSSELALSAKELKVVSDEQLKQIAVNRKTLELRKKIAQAMAMEDATIRKLANEYASLTGSMTRAEAATKKFAIAAALERQIMAGFRASMASLGLFFGVYTSATLLAATAMYTLAGGIKSAIKAGADFEDNMAFVGAITADAAFGTQEYSDALGLLSQKALDVSMTTRFMGSDVADAMKELGMAGLDMNDVLKSVEQTMQLAAIGGISFGEAADIATNVLYGFRLEISDLANVVDVMAAAVTNSNMTVAQLGNTLSYAAPVASAFGISLETVVAASEVLANSGIKASRAGTGLRRIILSLFEPTNEGAVALKNMGVSMDESADGSDQLVSALEDLYFATGGVEKNIGSLTEMVGVRAAPAFIQLVKSVGLGTKSLEELRDGLTKANVSGATEDMFLKISDTLKTNWLEMLSAIEAASVQAFEYIKDDLKDVLITITSVFREFAANPSKIWEVVDSLKALGSAALTAAKYLGLALVAYHSFKMLAGLKAIIWEVTAGLGATAVAGNAAAAGSTAAAAGLTAVSMAAKLVRVALLTTGIGALVVGLGYLISKFVEFKSTVEEASDASEGFSRILEDQKNIAQALSSSESITKKYSSQLEELIAQKQRLEELNALDIYKGEYTDKLKEVEAGIGGINQKLKEQKQISYDLMQAQAGLELKAKQYAANSLRNEVKTLEEELNKAKELLRQAEERADRLSKAPKPGMGLAVAIVNKIAGYNTGKAAEEYRKQVQDLESKLSHANNTLRIAELSLKAVEESYTDAAIAAGDFTESQKTLNKYTETAAAYVSKIGISAKDLEQQLNDLKSAGDKNPYSGLIQYSSDAAYAIDAVAARIVEANKELEALKKVDLTTADPSAVQQQKDRILELTAELARLNELLSVSKDNLERVQEQATQEGMSAFASSVSEANAELEKTKLIYEAYLKYGAEDGDRMAQNIQLWTDYAKERESLFESLQEALDTIDMTEKDSLEKRRKAYEEFYDYLGNLQDAYAAKAQTFAYEQAIENLSASQKQLDKAVDENREVRNLVDKQKKILSDITKILTENTIKLRENVQLYDKMASEAQRLAENTDLHYTAVMDIDQASFRELQREAENSVKTATKVSVQADLLDATALNEARKAGDSNRDALIRQSALNNESLDIISRLESQFASEETKLYKVIDRFGTNGDYEIILQELYDIRAAQYEAINKAAEEGMSAGEINKHLNSIKMATFNVEGKMADEMNDAADANRKLADELRRTGEIASTTQKIEERTIAVVVKSAKERNNLANQIEEMDKAYMDLAGPLAEVYKWEQAIADGSVNSEEAYKAQKASVEAFNDSYEIYLNNRERALYTDQEMIASGEKLTRSVHMTKTELEQLASSYNTIWSATRNYRLVMADLAEAAKMGYMTQDELRRAVRETALEFEAAKGPIHAYAASLVDEIGTAEDQIIEIFDNLTNVLADFFETGEFKFNDFVDAIKRSWAEKLASALVVNILPVEAGGLPGTGLLGGLLGGLGAQSTATLPTADNIGKEVGKEVQKSLEGDLKESTDATTKAIKAGAATTSTSILALPNAILGVFSGSIGAILAALSGGVFGLFGSNSGASGIAGLIDGILHGKDGKSGLTGLANIFTGNSIGLSIGNFLSGMDLATEQGKMLAEQMADFSLATKAGIGLAQVPNWAYGAGGILGSFAANSLFEGEYVNLGSSLGGLAGSAVGGASAIALGAAAGSVVPIIGTILGGLLGAVAGGWLGSLFGAKDPRPQANIWQTNGQITLGATRDLTGEQVAQIQEALSNLNASIENSANILGEGAQNALSQWNGDFMHATPDNLEGELNKRYAQAVERMLGGVMGETGRSDLFQPLVDQIRGAIHFDNADLAVVADALEKALEFKWLIDNTDQFTFALQALGVTFDSSIEGLKRLADAFGGIDEAMAAQANFIEKFASDTTKYQIQLENVQGMFDTINEKYNKQFEIPMDRQGFYDLVAGINVEINPELYAAFIALTDVMDQFYQAMDAATGGVTEAFSALIEKILRYTQGIDNFTGPELYKADNAQLLRDMLADVYKGGDPLTKIKEVTTREVTKTVVDQQAIYDYVWEDVKIQYVAPPPDYYDSDSEYRYGHLVEKIVKELKVVLVQPETYKQVTETITTEKIIESYSKEAKDAIWVLFDKMLDRTPDQSEMDVWLKKLHELGGNWEDLVDAFVADSTYLKEISTAMEKAAGGIDKLNEGWDAYQQYFMTPDERTYMDKDLAMREIQKVLADFIGKDFIPEGIGTFNIPTTMEGFKLLISSINTSTVEGAKLYGALMSLADEFAIIFDLINESDTNSALSSLEAFFIYLNKTGTKVDDWNEMIADFNMAIKGVDQDSMDAYLRMLSDGEKILAAAKDAASKLASDFGFDWMEAWNFTRQDYEKKLKESMNDPEMYAYWVSLADLFEKIFSRQDFEGIKNGADVIQKLHDMFGIFFNYETINSFEGTMWDIKNKFGDMLIEMVGGIDILSEGLDSLYRTIYSDDEIALKLKQDARRQIEEVFTKNGLPLLSIPESADELRKLFESLNPTNEADMKLMSVLIELGPLFETLFNESDNLSNSLNEASDALQKWIDNLVGSQDFPTSPENQLAYEMQRYYDIYEQVKAGDFSKLSELTSVSDSILELIKLTSGSQLEYNMLLSQILGMNAMLQRMIDSGIVIPKDDTGYALGGVSTGPSSGYTALLHGTEAIIPLDRGDVPVMITGSAGADEELTMEIQALRAEVAKMREELVREGKRTNTTLGDWKTNGILVDGTIDVNVVETV